MSGSISNIQQFFTNILERPVDPSGLAFFVNEASSGTPLSAIETQIATSPEAAKLVTPIVQLYEGILGRNPDQAGLNFWVNLFRSGSASLTQIANAFVTTSEGAAVLGASVSTASIATLYKTSLGRAASTSEVSFWVSTGLPLSQVAASIATSAEATVNLAALSLSYLLAAGQVQPTSSGQTIVINGQQASYIGTAGNDIFLAPVTQAPLTGFPIQSLQNSTIINGNGGADTLQAGLANSNGFLGSGTVAPTLVGIQTVQAIGSPGVVEIFDLSNSTGVTETDLINSSGANVSYTNGTAISGAVLSNSNGAALNVTPVAGSPVTAALISNSNGGTIVVSNDTSTAVVSTVTNSPNAAFSVGSLSASTGLTSLAVNATATTSSSAKSPDFLTLNDTDSVLKGLTVNSSAAGFERVLLQGATLGSSTVSIGGVGISTPTGQLSLGGTLTKASAIDASGYTGNLRSGAGNAALALAQGTTIPSTFAGVSSALAGLIVGNDANLTSIKTGTGSSIIDLSGEATPKAAFTFTGTGNNVVLLGNSVTTNGTFAGGSGANAIGIGDGATTTSGDSFSGFQTLEIGGGNGGTYNLAALSGVSTVAATSNGFGNPVTLNNAPDNLSVVETASPGNTLFTGSPVTVLLGAGAASPSIHSVNLTLNADGVGTDTKALVQGVVNAGPITVGQLANGTASATFLPGYSETVNLASNIFNAGGTAVAGSYTNSITGLTLLNATSINVTGAANLSAGTIAASSNLTSFNASKASGAVTTVINEGAQVSAFAYAGSTGVDNITFNATQVANAKFANTFNGGSGNDTFNVSDGASNGGVTNNFVYGAQTDAVLSDSGTKGVLLGDVGTTLSVETIGGFTAGAPGAGVDTINFVGLGLTNANVLIAGDTGSNIAGSGFTPGPSLTGNIATVAGLFNSASTEELYTAQGKTFAPAPPAGALSAGAFVYQAADQSVYVFAGASKGTNFSAANDLTIHLTGNFTANQVNAIAADLKFA